MINCNPETVSTDYDTSDRLYFEPLLEENVLNIIYKEMEKGKVLGVIAQFGGQTPIKLARTLNENKIPILGTQFDSIDLAEDRERFKKILLKENSLKVLGTPFFFNFFSSLTMSDICSRNQGSMFVNL